MSSGIRHLRFYPFQDFRFFGDSLCRTMVALYILCRVDSFGFGRFFDLACMDF